ncbi:MAG: cell filamentation protein Fic [Gemmatimonadetes bacterium]|nr:MAG: cell filamentation protein Fic [Gemmatimonadota bacterium]
MPATATRAGRWVRQQGEAEGFSAFLPARLPPDPPLQFTPELQRLSEAAGRAIGRLEGVSASLEPERLLYMYVRKEAVLSSAIEGTQSTLTDLLRFEAAGVSGTPLNEVREVSRYVAALLHGIKRIRSSKLLLSLRLIREIHGVLMTGARGGNKAPGEFRRTQNWVGGTRPGNARFVPPPPHDMHAALDNLERFLHDEYGFTAPVIKAGLAHAQFETIHPFLDGNGRVGRLLVSLMLVVDGVLSQPFLYLSLYFKRHRADYYDALQRVRTHGAWEEWLQFYLIGVEAVANQAADTATALVALFARDGARIQALGRAAGSALRVYDVLRRRIVVSISGVAKEALVTWPTAKAALERLEDLGIATESTGRRRDRLYTYRKQLAILDRGTM